MDQEEFQGAMGAVIDQLLGLVTVLLLVARVGTRPVRAALWLLLNRTRIDHLHDNERLHLHYGDLTDGVSLLNLVRSIEPDDICPTCRPMCPPASGITMPPQRKSSPSLP